MTQHIGHNAPSVQFACQVVSKALPAIFYFSLPGSGTAMIDIGHRNDDCGSFVVVTSTQDAFDRAREFATELLGEKDYTLEEIEQDIYKNRRVWQVTLGFPKRRISAPGLIQSIAASLPLEYKTFLVDVETGEPVAMKLAS